MSYSLKFCRNISKNPKRSSYADRDWENAIEVKDTEVIFDNILKGTRKLRVDGTNEYGDKIYLNIELKYNKDADFDYYTSHSLIHDGTLLFVDKAMSKCIEKVLLGQTYNRDVGAPQNGDTVKYIFGNFVVLNEYDGDFVPVNKPWLKERTTVLLPIKMMKE